MIKTKRVYEPALPQDGVRILIDRLWPRGIKKEDLKMDEWIREVAPSDELRKWFSHDPNRWDEFKRRYLDEIKEKEEFRRLVKLAREEGSRGIKDITLLFSSREEKFNNATALKEFIENTLQKG